MQDIFQKNSPRQVKQKCRRLNFALDVNFWSIEANIPKHVLPFYEILDFFHLIHRRYREQLPYPLLKGK
jgi:hypothetical protein